MHFEKTKNQILNQLGLLFWELVSENNNPLYWWSKNRKSKHKQKKRKDWKSQDHRWYSYLMGSELSRALMWSKGPLYADCASSSSSCCCFWPSPPAAVSDDQEELSSKIEEEQEEEQEAAEHDPGENPTVPMLASVCPSTQLKAHTGALEMQLPAFTLKPTVPWVPVAPSWSHLL